MLLPMNAERLSGVALRRFRISFSRCWTSGIAPNSPSCMRAIARIDGTK